MILATIVKSPIKWLASVNAAAVVHKRSWCCLKKFCAHARRLGVLANGLTIKLVSARNMTAGDGGADLLPLGFAGQLRQSEPFAAQFKAGGGRVGIRQGSGVRHNLLQEGVRRKAAPPRRLLESGRHFRLHPGLQKHCHTPSVIFASRMSTDGKSHIRKMDCAPFPPPPSSTGRGRGKSTSPPAG